MLPQGTSQVHKYLAVFALAVMCLHNLWVVVGDFMLPHLPVAGLVGQEDHQADHEEISIGNVSYIR